MYFTCLTVCSRAVRLVLNTHHTQTTCPTFQKDASIPVITSLNSLLHPYASYTFC